MESETNKTSETPEDIMTSQTSTSSAPSEKSAVHGTTMESDTKETTQTPEVSMTSQVSTSSALSEKSAVPGTSKENITIRVLTSPNKESDMNSTSQTPKVSMTSQTRVVMNLPEIDLLLLGKTGNGKSATGNTILGRRSFKSTDSASSVTVNIASEVVEYKGRVIKVVDGPGVGDTSMDDEAGMKLVKDAMNNAIAMNIRGYHAFLLVVRYGTRFTKEEKTAVQFLKDIFGENFLKNYCILIFTHGDIFEGQDDEDDEDGEGGPKPTFEEWCDEQEGPLKEIMQDCNMRVMLFNNKHKSKRSEQLDHLLKLVDSLQMQGNRYCDEHFERAKQARERAIVTEKEPQIRTETMEKTSLILQKLQQIGKLSEPAQQLEPLEELKTRVDDLYGTLKSQDKGTGALRGLMETVESTRHTINSEIQICQRMIPESERRAAEMQRNIENNERMEREWREREEEMRHQITELTNQFEQLRLENERRIAEQSKTEDKGSCTIL